MTEPAAAKRPIRQRLRNALLLLLLGALLGGALFVFLAFGGPGRVYEALAARWSGKEIGEASVKLLTSDPQSFVIVRRSALEVVITERNEDALGSTAKVLLIARGHASFGYDLSRLAPADIRVGHGVLTLRVPPLALYDTALDFSLSQVYDKQNGWTDWRKEEREDSAIRRAERVLRNRGEVMAANALVRRDAARQPREILESRRLEAFPGLHRVEVVSPEGDGNDDASAES